MQPSQRGRWRPRRRACAFAATEMRGGVHTAPPSADRCVCQKTERACCRCCDDVAAAASAILRPSVNASASGSWPTSATASESARIQTRTRSENENASEIESVCAMMSGDGVGAAGIADERAGCANANDSESASANGSGGRCCVGGVGRPSVAAHETLRLQLHRQSGCAASDGLTERGSCAAVFDATAVAGTPQSRRTERRAAARKLVAGLQLQKARWRCCVVQEGPCYWPTARWRAVRWRSTAETRTAAWRTQRRMQQQQ
jgi:hypothetical protein